MAFTTYDEAVKLAKEIEHEPRFTCEVKDLGTKRKPTYRIFVVDSYRQEENTVGNWFYVHSMVDGRDFWSAYRAKLREHEAARV